MVKMTFIATADNEEHRVIVDDHDKEDGVYSVDLNGKKFRVDAHTMPSQIVTALIDNKSYDLDIDDEDHQSCDPLDGRLAIRVRGRVVRLEMLEERRNKIKTTQCSKFAHAGNIQINSPMPGKVLRYLVFEGEEVVQGQGVVVIEAMKMENELQAPRAGVIRSLCAQAGAAVSGGTLLLTIE